MANYSKDMERQNKALKDLMSGKEYEKDYVQVGYEGKGPVDKGGETRQGKMTDIMKDVRMPWFCPKCKKTMKKKLDTKFWRTKGHCFDCQIEFENRLRLEGKFEDYAKNIELENKKSYLNDLKQSIDEFEDSDGKVEWLNSVGVQDVELEREKWEMGKTEFSHVVKEARDYITKIENEIDEEAKKLNIT
jgi:ribosomal protein L37AE/L43A|tara:strand:- start:420 stop:986 length:567 start_codon:yes stop_codon:yes gene_type:complete